MNARAKVFANNHARMLPDLMANKGPRPPATASIYVDGVILYLLNDREAAGIVASVVRGYVIEFDRSDDGNVTVFLLTGTDPLDQIAAAMTLTFTDCTLLDDNTIDDYFIFAKRVNARHSKTDFQDGDGEVAEEDHDQKQTADREEKT